MIDFENLTISHLMAELRRQAENCPKCEGTRETVFTARGRDNIVNCLECEPIYLALDHLEKAAKILQEG